MLVTMWVWWYERWRLTIIGVTLLEYSSFSHSKGVQALALCLVLLEISNKAGSILELKLSLGGVAGDECQAFEGPGDWPAQNANSPVVVPSMRLLISSNSGNPLLWKGAALGYSKGRGKWEAPHIYKLGIPWCIHPIHFYLPWNIALPCPSQIPRAAELLENVIFMFEL